MTRIERIEADFYMYAEKNLLTAQLNPKNLSD